ncbi:GH116 family glycosyl hydrolase [Vibrio olivae]|uniref:GH116 family glycosyl hydrolase n=1 Tax=Vibrio olivae TaxID=1243002 RepID=A0ABV5HPV6_9VIBR
MNSTIPYTSYCGLASELTSQGEAVEFIQPWYTPISTTPSNTGMAIGGIGSTFTLTPNGDTPNFSFIPGIFIEAQEDNIHFNDFYLSAAPPPCLEHLRITNLNDLVNHLKYYPAQFCGQVLTAESETDALTAICQALEQGDFYQQNRANFERWQVVLSAHTRQALDAVPNAVDTQIFVALDFFNGIVFDERVYARRLTASQPNLIDAVDGERIEYRALYPIAEYRYHHFEQLDVKRKVISPIVRHDAKLCALPGHWNEFEFTNHSVETQVITLVQPLANLMGSTYRKGRDGIQDSACRLVQNPNKHTHVQVNIDTEDGVFTGVRLSSDSPYGSDVEGDVVFGVHMDTNAHHQGNISVSTKPSIYTSNVETEVKSSLLTARTQHHFERGIYSGREALSAIVCVRIELEPNECQAVRFFQVMDHAKIALDGWQSRKAYARYFKTPQQPDVTEETPNRCLAIMQTLLNQYSSIEQRIIDQQQAFYAKARSQFDGEDTALKYATMAMNTLSFISESTVWDEQHKFLVKECVDYPFFNSLDVYFYGSFSILYLLPELDGHVMKAFACAILDSDNTLRRYWEYEDKPFAELVDEKYQGVRAIRGAVIHDLGSPYDIQPDAYSWHNVKEWKDLAPKFVLMVYRHYQRTGDKTVVDACWPAVKESIAFLQQLIEPGEHFPLTRGTDDTFDNLSSHGISIYCGSLWVAGLTAASRLAQLMDEEALSIEYSKQSVSAHNELEESLWDEARGYFHFFVTPIQAKHLTGEGTDALAQLGLNVTGDRVHDANVLNRWLNHSPQPDTSKYQQRRQRKAQLLQHAPHAFTPSYASILELDSDNSFGDALLADTYLKLVDEPQGLFATERVSRALDYLYQHNFEINSPMLGVANMTLADGAPHEAFQAQDVWIGVQFSTAAALKLAGKQQQAETLVNTVYEALYAKAKIPFAAPEGFNCSVAVSGPALCDTFNIGPQQAQQWLKCLKRANWLFDDGRVNPNLPKDLTQFIASIGRDIELTSYEGLHRFLINTGLKYTAGRYFRPGMIFSLVD